jgi:hypothetical protein
MGKKLYNKILSQTEILHLPTHIQPKPNPAIMKLKTRNRCVVNPQFKKQLIIKTAVRIIPNPNLAHIHILTAY